MSVPSDTPLLSGNQLYTRAGISVESGKKKMKLLASLGIVTVQTGKTGQAKLFLLVADWLERLQAIAPALNNYGETEIRQQRADIQAEQWHGHRLANWPATPTAYYSPDAKARTENAYSRAVKRLAAAVARLDALNDSRHVYAAQQGIGCDIPAVSLIHADRLPPQQQPVTVTGNKLVPTGRVFTGPLVQARPGPPPATDEQLEFMAMASRAIADWNEGKKDDDKTNTGHHAARLSLVPAGQRRRVPKAGKQAGHSSNGPHLLAAPRGHHEAQRAVAGIG